MKSVTEQINYKVARLTANQIRNQTDQPHLLRERFRLQVDQLGRDSIRNQVNDEIS